MGRDQRRKGAVDITGPWLPVGLQMLRSVGCANLSPHAAKLLLDLMAQLGAGGHRNGDISATPAYLKARGWTSTATARAALKELEQVGLLVITRRGHKRACTLYGITLWAMQCDPKKLDCGPGAWTMNDWRKMPGGADPPTEESPAVWNRPRKATAQKNAASRGGT